MNFDISMPLFNAYFLSNAPLQNDFKVYAYKYTYTHMNTKLFYEGTDSRLQG